MNQTLTKVINMMSFLGAEDYIIPSFGLAMPDDIKGYDIVANRTFRFFRRTNTMSYIGVGDGNKRICVMGIKPSEPYINALHDALVRDCKRFIADERKKTHMPFLPQILCKFGGVEFVIQPYQ
jgi:hypothetical protein